MGSLLVQPQSAILTDRQICNFFQYWHLMNVKYWLEIKCQYLMATLFAIDAGS